MEALPFRVSRLDRDDVRLPDGEVEFSFDVRVAPGSPEYEAFFKAMMDRKPVTITL